MSRRHCLHHVERVIKGDEVRGYYNIALKSPVDAEGAAAVPPDQPQPAAEGTVLQVRGPRCLAFPNMLPAISPCPAL